MQLDWPTVFDQGFPAPGASEPEIEQFTAEIRLPLSGAEIQEVNLSQRNPFPKHNPLNRQWRPFDASHWTIPTAPLPPAYLSLLRYSNGGEFRTGERWFQFFPANDPQHGVRAMLLAYHIPQYMPDAFPLGFDGGGTFYLLDVRHPHIHGEYPVVCAHAGNLEWHADAYWHIADSILEACSGRIEINALKRGGA